MYTGKGIIPYLLLKKSDPFSIIENETVNSIVKIYIGLKSVLLDFASRQPLRICINDKRCGKKLLKIRI